MFEIFRRNILFNNILLLLLAFVLKLGHFIYGVNDECILPNPLVDDLLGNFYLDGVWGVIVSALIIFFNSALINRISILYRINKEQTAIPGFIYILLMSFFESFSTVSAGLVSSILLLLVIPTLFKTYNNNKAVKLLFSLGFFCAVAQIIYFPFIVITISIYFTLFGLRSFRMKDNLQFFIGLLTCYYLLGVAYYLNFGTIPSISEYLTNRISWDTYLQRVTFTWRTFAVHFFWVFLVLISVLRYGTFVSKKPNIVQRRIAFMYTMMFLSFLGLLFHVEHYVIHLTYLIIPASYVIADILMNFKNKMIPELITFSALILSLLIQFNTIPI